MKNNDILDAFEGVSEKYVAEVAELRKGKAKRRSLAPRIAAAACLVLAIGAVFFTVHILNKPGKPYDVSTQTPVPANTDASETASPAPTEAVTEPDRLIYVKSYEEFSEMFRAALTLTDAEYEAMLESEADGHYLMMNGIESRGDMLEVMELLRNVPLPRSDMFELMRLDFHPYGNWQTSDRTADFLFKDREHAGDYCRITIWSEGELSSYDGWLDRYEAEEMTFEQLSASDFPEFTRILRTPETEDAPESSTRIRSTYVGECGGYAVCIRLSSTNTEWMHPTEEYVRSFTFGTFGELINEA